MTCFIAQDTISWYNTGEREFQVDKVIKAFPNKIFTPSVVNLI